MSSFEYTLKLILKQEIKRCHLLKYKYISSEDELIFLFLNDIEVKALWDEKQSLPELKAYVLDSLYSKHIKLIDNPLFDNWIYEIYKRVLLILLNKHGVKLTIDESLNPTPHTLAYRASRMFLAEIYSFDTENYGNCLSADSIENDIHKICSVHYPVELARLMKQLKMKDKDFWDVIWFIMGSMAEGAVNYSINTRNGFLLFRDKAQEDKDWVAKVLTDTSRIISQKIDEDKLIVEDAESLSKYIRATIINVVRNAFRTLDKKKEIDLVGFNEQNLGSSIFYELPIVASDDFEDIRNVLLDILYNNEVKAYEMLTKGIKEEGLAVIKYKALGYSYDDYIEDVYGKNISAEEKKKENQRLRKSVERALNEIRIRIGKIYMK